MDLQTLTAWLTTEVGRLEQLVKTGKNDKGKRIPVRVIIAYGYTIAAYKDILNKIR